MKVPRMGLCRGSLQGGKIGSTLLQIVPDEAPDTGILTAPALEY